MLPVQGLSVRQSDDRHSLSVGNLPVLVGEHRHSQRRTCGDG
jgi:hypothetical protein